ncbi:MAG: hypothetical protein V4543_10990 [Bacteroidota bacterium]
MADCRLVWDCYTKSELLDQWFAPAPFENDMGTSLTTLKTILKR